MKNIFDWGNLSTDFIQAIVYSSKTKQKPSMSVTDKDLLVPYINNICPKPTKAFVKTYRREIEEHFLKDSSYLIGIAKNFNSRNLKGMDMSSMETMFESIQNRRGTDTILELFSRALYQAGCRRTVDADDAFLYTNPLSIDLKASEDGIYSLFDYQEKAFAALGKYFVDDDKQAGILMMPTGSGKTRVVTRFMLEDMIAAGYQVVFLTHRAMLIEQAGGSVFTAAPILKHLAPEKDRFNMICISGNHASIKQANKSDDVIVLSVQTAIRNIDYLKAVISEKVLIVCDEMHHSTAPSFAITINEIRKLANKSKLLGLTATPVRSNDKETIRLMNMYDNTIVHRVDAADLIARGYLSTPIIESVPTNINMETIITIDEQKYIDKWGEISPELLDKMADIKERNAVIVEQYMRNREKYGKTLIFALNSKHCISLCEELQAKDVRCDYIYCAHPGNEQKIAKFKNGELDVLVNINVLSEGSDIPSIQTVFLTRPTQSDVLLMQMCGRGMRGKACGGTETVNIVDFHDMWGRAQAWLNAEVVLCGESSDNEEEKEAVAPIKSKPEWINWAMIRDLLNGIETVFAPGGDFVSNVTLPSGWYDVVAEDGNDTKVMFFASQLDGYRLMWENKDKFMKNPTYTGDDALAEFFSGIGLMPTGKELDLVINTARMCGEMLHPHALEGRKSVDAAVVAEKIISENIGYNDIAILTRDIYEEKKEMVDSIYGGYKEYHGRVLDFLRYPNGIRPLGTKVEEMEPELLHYDSTPEYDLNELTGEVIEEMFEGDQSRFPQISWTERRYASYFGQYNYCKDRSKDFIKINCILNSPDVPREVVKYIIYHEMLHRDNRLHNPAFRAMEHLYPGWVEHERFLDGTFFKFDINYSL